MTTITRRGALLGAGAAVVAAGVPGAVQGADSEEAQVLALFLQLGDRERASVHFWARFYARLPDDPEIRRRFIGEVRPH